MHEIFVSFFFIRCLPAFQFYWSTAGLTSTCHLRSLSFSEGLHKHSTLRIAELEHSLRVANNARAMGITGHEAKHRLWFVVVFLRAQRSALDRVGPGARRRFPVRCEQEGGVACVKSIVGGSSCVRGSDCYGDRTGPRSASRARPAARFPATGDLVRTCQAWETVARSLHGREAGPCLG